MNTFERAGIAFLALGLLSVEVAVFPFWFGMLIFGLGGAMLIAAPELNRVYAMWQWNDWQRRKGQQ